MRPSTDSVRSVPSASMRSSRALLQALDQPVLEVAQLAPGRRRLAAVEEQRAAHEGGELGRAHAGLLRARGGRPQRQAPAARERRLAHGRAGAGRARHPLGVDVRQRARVDRRLDADRGVGGLRLGELGRREAVEVRVARVLPERLVGAGQLGPDQRPGLAHEDLLLEREQQRRGERGRAHDDLLAGLDLQAVVAQQRGEARGVGRHRRAPRRRGSARRGARAAPRGSSAARPGSRTGSGPAAPSA